MKKVEITWVDSCSNKSAWSPDEEAKEWGNEGAVCMSVGYLVQRTKKGFTLALSHHAQDDCLPNWGGLWFVPAGCVRKVKVLR